jgi:hypothetical protein
MAEQSDFGARKHVHISFDVFRDGIAYSYPRRKKTRSRSGTIMRRIQGLFSIN